MLRSTHVEETQERAMSDSVYKVIEIIGTSKKFLENAANFERASILRDLRVVGEVAHH